MRTAADVIADIEQHIGEGDMVVRLDGCTFDDIKETVRTARHQIGYGLVGFVDYPGFERMAHWPYKLVGPGIFLTHEVRFV